ncbi:MAG TPA: low specificity L-threonine aldolase [Stellaceae bacterium]|nr:low specificity L-threonine aldolase [Stellaceae bacterium]
MNFRSDNVTGVAPEIMAALAAANAGAVTSYGDDPITRRLSRHFAEVFEREVAVFPVSTGTAANALALATMAPPYGVIYGHKDAHIQVDECGAPEFFSGGAKLLMLDGADGKISARDLEAVVAGGGKGGVHHAQPAAVSLTQATEAGTIYRMDEIAEIAAVCRRYELGLHMDGSRFANAAVALNRSPAELTWKAGVDALSFGATKNGALAAEAVVFFDPAKAADFAFRRKRGGHLFSKMRFLSAQLEAYLAGDLWLRNARHANAMAARLSEGLARLPGARLRHPTEANEVFVELPETVIRGLLAGGFEFYRWGGESSACIRLVTAFSTEAGSVEAFLAAAQRLSGGQPR